MNWKDNDQDAWLEEIEMTNPPLALKKYCELAGIPISKFKRARKVGAEVPYRLNKSLSTRESSRSQERTHLEDLRQSLSSRKKCQC